MNQETKKSKESIRTGNGKPRKEKETKKGECKRTDTVIPSGGHDILDDISLLSSSESEPASPIAMISERVKSQPLWTRKNMGIVRGLTWRSYDFDTV